MKNLVISSVGTSFITNQASKVDVNTLYQYSNCTINDCPEEIKNLIDSYVPQITEKLSKAENNSIIRRLSAELNGIFGFYNNNLNNKNNDFHFFISTDTYQGLKSAEVVKNYIRGKGIPCEIYTPRNLSTKNKDSFSDGIKDLLKWFDEIVNEYKKSGYQIIFNLTGGFKSLQGFLNTIAMFYADKIIYIFESQQAELIEIPRLPIQIDYSIFQDNLDKFLLLKENSLNKSVLNIPESLYDEIDNKIIFSVWGELLWNKVKYDLLDKLIPLPSLVYEDSFKKCFENIIDKGEKVKLLETLAKVSSLLIESNGNIDVLKRDGGLLYENYNNKYIDGQLPIGHFRINQGDRISCFYKNQKLYLRKYGRHDFVNTNP